MILSGALFMRTKCIPQKTNLRYAFFLFMIMPLFIGFLFTFISNAHGEWDHEQTLRPSPITQGWILFEESQEHHLTPTGV